MYGASTRKAVVLDEHPLWLSAMETLLDGMGVAVVGKTTAPSLALALVAEHQPDVLIATLGGSDRELDGLACVRRVRDEHPSVVVVVLSGTDEPDEVDAAFEAGAAVYCVKTAEPQDVSAAIRQSLDRSIYFATARGRPVRGRERRDAGARRPELTRRELEVLKLVSDGYSNSALAELLRVTEQTVKFHLTNVYRKLGVANRTEAARWAHVHRLLPSSR